MCVLVHLGGRRVPGTACKALRSLHPLLGGVETQVEQGARGRLRVEVEDDLPPRPHVTRGRHHDGPHEHGAEYGAQQVGALGAGGFEDRAEVGDAGQERGGVVGGDGDRGIMRASRR